MNPRSFLSATARRIVPRGLTFHLGENIPARGSRPLAAHNGETAYPLPEGDRRDEAALAPLGHDLQAALSDVIGGLHLISAETLAPATLGTAIARVMLARLGPFAAAELPQPLACDPPAEMPAAGLAVVIDLLELLVAQVSLVRDTRQAPA